MATTSSNGHVRKRQYQPSITSYFNNRSANGTTLEQLRPSQSPLSPPLPADTQASLLSVGMRVRKSVPEGYKTHKTLPAQGFPFPSTAPPAAPARSNTNTRSTRELTPFCGLHKTGGWAAQELPTSSAPAAMQTDDEGLPGLMGSQTAPSRKRGYEEEAEEEMDAFFDEVEVAEAMEQQALPAGRPMANLKGTASGGAVRIVGGDDFEEAGFLAPLDGMEVDDG
ncbi:uncharacterized protein LTR77_008173 [Saxophila tyrrhenica]|uniref:Uncharacterized protein n=1 Tax=Saxophila tyrrhenica TaxID=1690608 RepID=A0AAV9P622_9PEZI|nr:hypothetical protein LTR77_008173 [Saxophila tyrrhenica]